MKGFLYTKEIIKQSLRGRLHLWRMQSIGVVWCFVPAAGSSSLCGGNGGHNAYFDKLFKLLLRELEVIDC